MKNIFGFTICLVFLSACSSGKDEQFCECLKAGEKLNAFSTQMFERDITKEDADQLKKLKETKKAACVNYQAMTGDEMLKRKSECQTK